MYGAVCSPVHLSHHNGLSYCMVQYAVQFISLTTMDYHTVWCSMQSSSSLSPQWTIILYGAVCSPVHLSLHNGLSCCMVQYAVQFISLTTMDYHAVWCSMQSSSSLSPQWTIMLYGGASFTHPLFLSGLMFSSWSNFYFLFLHPTESLSVFSHK